MKLSFKFLQTGGVPLTNDLMALLEESYGIFEVLAELAGNLTILAGCAPVVPGSSTYSPGIVAIEGRLYYFEGGLATSTVFIFKQEIQKTFQDQTPKTLIEKRTVRFGNGITNYNWSDFTRLKTIFELSNKIDQKANVSDLNALNALVMTLLQNFNAHIQSANNPHQVTLAQLGIIKKARIHLGDIQGKPIGWSQTDGEFTITLINRNNSSTSGGDDLYKVDFNSVATADYNVLATLSSDAPDSTYNSQNDLSFIVMNKTSSSFNVAVREYSQSVQDIYCEFIMLKN